MQRRFIAEGYTLELQDSILGQGKGDGDTLALLDSTRKVLWARSGNRCALCKTLLIEKATKGLGRVLVGEECHIVAKRRDGPRGTEPLESDVDNYGNFILLCRNDHRRIDTQPEWFSVRRLVTVKRQHEQWVEYALGGLEVPTIDGRHDDTKNADELLRAMGPLLVGHPPAVTGPQDYFSFIEEQSIWNEGNGRILSANQREVRTIWDNFELYSVYEASLLRHVEAGGVVERAFVVGPQLRTRSDWVDLSHVLYRHAALGFEPRVVSILDLKRHGRTLGVECDVFGVTAGQVAFFIQFAGNAYPRFVRTVDRVAVEHTTQVFEDLYDLAIPFDGVRKEERYCLPDAHVRLVEDECALIRGIAYPGR